MAGSEKKHLDLVKWAVKIGGTLNQSIEANHQDSVSSYTGMVCSFSHSYQCFYYYEESAFSAPDALGLLSPLESVFKNLHLNAFYLKIIKIRQFSSR